MQFREEDSAADLGEDVFNTGHSLTLSFTPFKFTKMAVHQQYVIN